jgi:hypothetical protein
LTVTAGPARPAKPAPAAAPAEVHQQAHSAEVGGIPLELLELFDPRLQGLPLLVVGAHQFLHSVVHHLPKLRRVRPPATSKPALTTAAGLLLGHRGRGDGGK